MSCEQFREDLELYAAGALEREPANALAEHLATGCRHCHEALQEALEQSRLISSAVPLVDPPRRLRRRVHEAIAPGVTPSRRWLPWLVAAAAVLLLAVGLRQQLRSSSSSAAEQSRVSAMLEILGAPGTQSIPFTDAKTPALHGTIYLHQKLGAALVVDRLPDAPPGWKYESWLVPRGGAPRPVESFEPDGHGRAMSLVRGPVNPAEISAIAVSMEPEHSRPVKPTTLVFAART